MADQSTDALNIPRRSTELHDPGTHQLEPSDGEEEHFSDASEGRYPPTSASPIPTTRVERIDTEPSHGEVPGTPAYEQRRQDAVPDEIEVVPEGQSSRRASSANSRPLTPGGTPVPQTIVEKVDPSSPSHGDVPGTEAWEKRRADATPDVVRRVSVSESPNSQEDSTSAGTPGNLPIPETKVTRVDAEPAYGEEEGTVAAEMRQQDATPDKVEIAGDVPSSPTSDLNRSEHRSHVRRKSTLTSEAGGGNEAGEDDGFGDDFEDFEEGEQGEDFGDFGDEFEETSFEEQPGPPTPAPATPFISYPLIDYADMQSFPELQAALSSHLDALFPSTTDLDSVPIPEPITDSSPIFPSERSRSLWKQLITPPPLQPPNWTRSRIRRLFLVSLGVPVDLDEILPPSKQKKLVLPDINLDSPRKSESDKAVGSVARLKKEANDSSQSVDSQRSASKSRRKGGRKGPEPPPELDLTAVKRLYATTDEKLDGFTDEELKIHISELEEVTGKTSEVLEYWLKRRDMARAEKEAFEGVIENLVRHARRVRK